MARTTVTGSLFRNQELDFTSLRDLSVTGRSAGGEPGPPNLYEQAHARAGQLKGDLHYALASDRTLLRVFDFPSDDPEEIEGMVDLRVEKIAPFPVDHMYVSHEILSQSDSQSRVLIVAAQRKWVDHAGDSFAEAGLALRRVDVDVLGWLHLVQAGGDLPEQGRQLLLLMDAAGTELVLVEDGLPLAFRSLGVAEEDETPDEFMESLAEELEYSLTAFEGEWGNEPVQGLTVWHRGAEPPGLQRLGGAAAVVMRTESLETLGPLSHGVALRGAAFESGRGLIDLSPPSWMERIRDKQARRGLYMGALAMVGLFLLYLLGVMLFSKYQQRVYEDVLADSRGLKAPFDAVGEMMGNVAFLKGFTDRSQSSLETLKQMTDAMPMGVSVLSMSFTKEKHEVKIKGNTRDPGLINQWYEQLNASQFLTLVDQNRNRSRTGTWDFSFTATLNLPDDGIEGGEADGDTSGDEA